MDGILKTDMWTVETFAGRDSNEGTLAAGTKIRNVVADRTVDGPVWRFEAQTSTGAWLPQRSFSAPVVA